MKRRRLPIGVQTFRELRESDSYYVDKTPWIGRLLDEGKHYFLSRPRRFGKSLLLDTMKELFEGNEPLFRGLAIHDRRDWSVRRPVVRLSFGSGDFTRPDGLRKKVSALLDGVERRAGIRTGYDTGPERLFRILEMLHEESGRRAAVLVDEYDKPILDPLFSDPPDKDGEPRGSGTARANRAFLRGLYSVIKDADAHLRFSFLTGVSKFAKVSLFSGLNNLRDITLDRRYAAICGYSEADLDEVFAPELPGLDRKTIRDWYDGYCWRGEERMYNPFGVLLLFDTREFAPHWFETGSPRFLVETLFRRRIATPRLDDLPTATDLLSAFDIEHIGTEALLFQTGYLTIAGEERLGPWTQFRLRYPNLEVRKSLNEHLLRRFDPSPGRVRENQFRLYRLLEANDTRGLRELFRAFFAGIPHQWHTKNDIANYEGYYASVFYSYFTGLGAEVTVEDSTNLGRLDLAVRAAGRIYLFEFKVIEQSGAGSAMAQLLERRYAEKYAGRGEPVQLVGVEFSSRTRNIERFEVRDA